jgi:transcriptional regulator with XRE-family HTH domain
MRPGELIRERRLRHGLSQRRLAHRAGTSQSAIARIERGDEDVTWKRLESLLLAIGEEPVLESKPVVARYDAWDLEEQRKRPPALRLANGLAFSKFSSKLALAGRAARRVA